MRLRCTALRAPSDATSNETPRSVSVADESFRRDVARPLRASFSAHSGRPAPPPTGASLCLTVSTNTVTSEPPFSSLVTSS